MINGQGSGQYGGDRILALVFRDQETGLLVDVGAADGYKNSNSIGLLKRPGWKGILIEPEPDQFLELKFRYRNRNNVVCLNCAVGSEEGIKDFYCAGQGSTFKEETKKFFEEYRGVIYGPTIPVQIFALTRILEDQIIEQDIDFLSIDVEGMDYDVWMSLDKSKFSPKLICIEGKRYSMEGYKKLCSLGGNIFYLREDLCATL